jgi:hypothetical protein
LSVADEKRCAAIAAEVVDEVTYLGAHVVPAELTADATRSEATPAQAGAAAQAGLGWSAIGFARGVFRARQNPESGPGSTTNPTSMQRSNLPAQRELCLGRAAPPWPAGRIRCFAKEEARRHWA